MYVGLAGCTLSPGKLDNREAFESPAPDPAQGASGSGGSSPMSYATAGRGGTAGGAGSSRAGSGGASSDTAGSDAAGSGAAGSGGAGAGGDGSSGAGGSGEAGMAAAGSPAPEPTGCLEACALMTQRCATAGCHDASGSSAMLNLATPGVADRLSGADARSSCVGRPLLDTSNPDDSVFIAKIAGTSCGIQMPYGAPLSASELACLERWAADPRCSD
jgi:hypothetical protein